MSNLTDKKKLELSSVGFTDREITLYRQKFYNLLNTVPTFVAHNTVQLAEQRNELLSALKGMLSLHEPEGRFQPSHYKPFLFRAVEAIRKVDPGYDARKGWQDGQTAVEQRDELLQTLRHVEGALDTGTERHAISKGVRFAITKIEGGL